MVTKKHKQIRSPSHPPYFLTPFPKGFSWRFGSKSTRPSDSITSHSYQGHLALVSALSHSSMVLTFVFHFISSSRRFLFGSSAYFLAQEKANTWETWPPVWPSAVTRSISTRTSQWRWWPAFSEGCARATCGASWKTSICSPDRSCPSFPVTFR